MRGRSGPAAVAAVVIKLSQGKAALIDFDDLERVSRHTWSAAWMHYDWRAVSQIEGKTVYLHRFIMNANPGEEVDHVHGLGLDCRKSELRIATHSQNNCNAFRPGKQSQFKGVRPTGGKWRARIKVDRKQQSLGSFATEEEAARAYDVAARENFGEFAYTNFEKDGTPHRDRTCNLDLRRVALYPIELGAPKSQSVAQQEPQGQIHEQAEMFQAAKPIEGAA